jgi:hypothetical protein
MPSARPALPVASAMLWLLESRAMWWMNRSSNFWKSTRSVSHYGECA